MYAHVKSTLFRLQLQHHMSHVISALPPASASAPESSATAVSPAWLPTAKPVPRSAISATRIAQRTPPKVVETALQQVACASVWCLVNEARESKRVPVFKPRNLGNQGKPQFAYQSGFVRVLRGGTGRLEGRF